MKSLLLACVATAAAAVSAANVATCPPARVYMFDAEQQHETKPEVSDTKISSLDIDQTQLVLADFMGTSHLYPAKPFPAGFKHGCKKGMFGHRNLNGNPATAIVIVNGLPTTNGLDLFETSPAFEIEEAPSPWFFKAMVDKIAQEVGEVTGGEVKASVDRAVHIISEWTSTISNEIDGFFKKEKRSMDDTEHTVASQRVIDDISHIRSLSSKLQRGETAILRVESPSLMLEEKAHEYMHAVQAIKSALKSVREESPELRLIVVAAPSDACTHKARNLLKRSPAAIFPISSLQKRSVLTASAGPFGSKEDCETATDSCSGRGSCVKLVSGEYTCACKSTYDSTKKKTTRWGGSACEKKDVSFETQMFLWSGVGIVFTILAGVKMLVSVGNDPLPGILNVAKRSSS